MVVLGIVLAVVVVLALLAISYKNKFVVLDNRVKNAWSQIDVQMQSICLQIQQLKKWKPTTN